NKLAFFFALIGFFFVVSVFAIQLILVFLCNFCKSVAKMCYICNMQEKDKELFLKMLKQHGYSVTLGRMMVFKALWRQPPIEIGSLFKKLDGGLDRASLYRTIRLFEQIGVVHRISIGWKYKIELAEAFNHHHHHL